jgi:hypothetical protein
VKKVVSLGLIMVMSLQCFYKLGVITYFQINREYIAEMFCINKEKPITTCYGQCFLEKNLGLTDTAGHNESTVPVGKEKVDFPLFIVSECMYALQERSQFNRTDAHYIAGISSEHRRAPFHPPSQVM